MQRAVKKQKEYKEPGPVVKSTEPLNVGETVTVACKCPNGLILRIFKMDDFAEPVMGGGFRTVPRATQIGQQVVIRGPAIPWGVVPSFPIVGGYALTEGVPADFWDTWLEQNKDTDMVTNRQIYAEERVTFVKGMAKDQSDIRSGLEPMTPGKDPRNVKPRHMNLTPIEAGNRETA